MEQPIKRYQPRPARFLELWQEKNWRLKSYGISQPTEIPDSRLIDVAREIAPLVFPRPAVTPTRYGLGFITVHQAEMFNQIIFDHSTQVTCFLYAERDEKSWLVPGIES